MNPVFMFVDPASREPRLLLTDSISRNSRVLAIRLSLIPGRRLPDIGLLHSYGEITASVCDALRAFGSRPALAPFQRFDGHGPAGEWIEPLYKAYNTDYNVYSLRQFAALKLARTFHRWPCSCRRCELMHRRLDLERESESRLRKIRVALKETRKALAGRMDKQDLRLLRAEWSKLCRKSRLPRRLLPAASR